MADPLTVDTVLDRTEHMLATAEQGLADLSHADRSRRVAAFKTVVVFGRSVTFALQTLRTVDRDRFNTWYAPYEREMATDALFQKMNRLRTLILHEGAIGDANVIQSSPLSGPVATRVLASRPAQATDGPFIDEKGVMWEVRQLDGSVTPHYVDVGEDVRLRVWWTIPGIVPKDEATPENAGVEPLCRRYLARLREIVEAARAEFAEP